MFYIISYSSRHYSQDLLYDFTVCWLLARLALWWIIFSVFCFCRISCGICILHANERLLIHELAPSSTVKTEIPKNKKKTVEVKEP